ncbi:MAG: hypothetical protein IJT25_01240 [Clostridia bacterium]|nr:hypothetical protein [Clostridia bacterium]
MSSKKVISFFIVAVAVLLVSAVACVGIVLGRKKITAPQIISSYAFNFYETNSSEIRERSSSKLTLNQAVSFKPSQSTSFSENFFHKNGDSASDGVDYSITKYSSYVALIPFTAKNGSELDKHFKIDLSSEDIITASTASMKESLLIKIYCYETDSYYTEEEFNSANLEAKPGQICNFCLVAICDETKSEGVNFGTDYANLNFLIYVVA